MINGTKTKGFPLTRVPDIKNEAHIPLCEALPPNRFKDKLDDEDPLWLEKNRANAGFENLQ